MLAIIPELLKIDLLKTKEKAKNYMPIVTVQTSDDFSKRKFTAVDACISVILNIGTYIFLHTGCQISILKI